MDKKIFQVEKTLSEDEATIYGERKSRGETRTRKALKNFSYIKLSGITKASFQKSKNVVFVITGPDVYTDASYNSFLIFGEPAKENQKNIESR